MIKKLTLAIAVMALAVLTASGFAATDRQEQRHSWTTRTKSAWPLRPTSDANAEPAKDVASVVRVEHGDVIEPSARFCGVA